MPVPRRLIGSSVAVLIVLVLAGGIYLRITGSDTPEGGTSAAEGGEDAPDVSANASFATDVPIPVEGAVVVQDTLVVSVAAAAQAAAPRRATQTAQVQGRVTAVRVRENQRVGGAHVLLEIDPTEYQLGVDKAAAALTRAEAQFREATLFDDQIADSTVRADATQSATEPFSAQATGGGVGVTGASRTARIIGIGCRGMIWKGVVVSRLRRVATYVCVQGRAVNGRLAAF